jgi:hypothetical protein
MKLTGTRTKPVLILAAAVTLLLVLGVYSPTRNALIRGVAQITLSIQAMQGQAAADAGIWTNPNQLPEQQPRDGKIYFALAAVTWTCNSNNQFQYRWDIAPWRQFIVPSLNKEVFPVDRTDSTNSCLNIDGWKSLKWLLEDLYKDFKQRSEFLQYGDVWLKWAGILK